MQSIETQETALTRSEALEKKEHLVWDRLSKISLIEATETFLNSLEGHTKRSYRAAFQAIFTLFEQRKLFNPHANLQTFSLANLEMLLDEIKTHIPGSEATKQARAAAFISLTRFLQRATEGVIRKASPKKDKATPTFRPVRATSATKALTRAQWTIFLLSLKRLSLRDYLVAKTILQGAKRISEVLTAEIEQINWEESQITFRQLKSKELEKQTIITYPQIFMEELKTYLGERKKGPIFITRRSKPLTQPHLYRSFVQASIQSGLPFKVHPHVLRASAITYLAMQGFSADQIVRISGHADTRLVRYYDKTPLENNPSKNVSLIS